MLFSLYHLLGLQSMEISHVCQWVFFLHLCYSKCLSMHQTPLQQITIRYKKKKTLKRIRVETVSSKDQYQALLTLFCSESKRTICKV